MEWISAGINIFTKLWNRADYPLYADYAQTFVADSKPEKVESMQILLMLIVGRY